MSAIYGISTEAVIEIMNQDADEMESVCHSFDELSETLEETAKSLELEFTIESNRLELEKLLLEKIEFEDIVIEQEQENPEPHHREKLLPYNKRRKFVKKPYWNRIRSRCW